MHESSDKALKIMIATTIMAVIMITWCLITLAVNGPANDVPFYPDLSKKDEHAEVKVMNAGDKQPYRIASTENVKSVESSNPNVLSASDIKDKADQIFLAALTPGRATVTIIDVNGKEEQLDFMILNKDNERFTPQERKEKVWVADPTRSDRLEVAKDEHGNPVPKMNEALHKLGVEAQDDPIGFFALFSWGNALRSIGVIGLMMAFGHSILAMSGEETLAQVYREVESPKMLNFKKAAFIVFVYSMLLTAGISFLAILLIPDEVRMKFYSENLIGGLARHVIGPATC